MLGRMIQDSSKTLGIVGQGYVGLPLAMEAIKSGWRVIGIDTSLLRVEQLNAGRSPVEDISDSVLQKALLDGMYLATSDYSMIEAASVVAICVPTPLNAQRKPDLSLLSHAATNLAPFVSNETLVVSESTSFPGTLRRIIVPIIESSKPLASKTVYYASAPERVNPGDQNWSQKNTPRLIGAIDDVALGKAISFYSSICDSVIAVTSPEVAEAAKLLENSFRLVNIALVNEIAQVCSASEVDINEVIDAAATKPYGFMPFRPGVGVGGHCIPVDPLYLSWWANEYGLKTTVIEVADEVNQDMPKYVAERAINLVDSSIKGPRVLVLGVAYKPGVGDVRETPATDLIKHLINLGATVAWHDPLVQLWNGETSTEIDWDCDVAVLSTNQPGMELKKLIAKGVPILDCTNSIKDKSIARPL
jgi:UDP-N-acetyl-D-glucosamine dehydrogenase